MLFFIICGVLFAFGIILIIVNRRLAKKWKNEDWRECLGWVFTVGAFLFSLVLGASLLTIEQDFAYTEAQYSNLKEQVDYVNYDYILTDANIRNQVLEMNNQIAKHRTYCHNPWVGLWYSEHIGNLENLEWQDYVD